MRGLFTTAAVLLGVAGAYPVQAQTLRVMKSLDAPHYDGQRTTWSPSSDIVNMFQDTLVAMDWDGKDRKLFADKLREIDVPVARGQVATSLAEAKTVAAEIGYPLILRAGFSLGGRGSATA